MPVLLGDKIKQKLENDIRRQLKIPRTSPIPADIQTVISKTASEAGKVSLQSYVKSRAIAEGKQIFRATNYQTAISTRLQDALAGVQLVTLDPKLQQILEENAKVLFAKKTALTKAGFTDSEAFQLLLAEVAAKKSK